MMRAALTTSSLMVLLVMGAKLESEASASDEALGDEVEVEELQARESPVLADTFTTCEFTLEGSVDLAKACDGTVLLDSIELECNSDWSLASPTMLRFQGGSCERLTDGQPHRVQATWPCDADGPALP